MNIIESVNERSTNNQKGLRVSTFATDYIYQGKCYSVSQRLTVESATNLYILFDMSCCQDRQVTVYTPVYDTTTGPININYYTGSDYTKGASLLSNNRLAGAPVPKCTITFATAGSTKGIKFSEGFVAAGHKSSASSQEGLEFVPPQESNILVELDNTNGTDATVFVNFVWFEV